MKIFARVKPNSKEEGVEKKGPNEFLLRVKAPAREGRANEAAIVLLSDFLGIPKSRIAVIRGRKSRDKIIEVV